jgi:hypothetical protein
MKIPADAVEDTLLLRGKVLRVFACSLPQADLRFYAENPRIYSALWDQMSEGNEPTQEEIFRALAKGEHVRETLVPSIRNNGGLIDPILVRKGVVLEGNSRLAAYRLLAQSDHEKWRHIRARVLPDDIGDSAVFSLLGEYHMVGKRDWQPYEQAGYLYRRSRLQQSTVEVLSAEVGLVRSKVEHLIAVYGFMVDHNDRSPDRWSYYDELLKGRRFDSVRKLYPKFDDFIAQKIASGEVARAVDLRDDLPKVVKAGGNTLKKFMGGAMNFQEAADDARLRGAGNYHATKLRTFRQWLAEDSVETEFSSMTDQEKKNVRYELEKIHTRAAQLVQRIDKLRR